MLVALLGGAAHADVQLRLRPEVELLTAHYRLGDIAEITAKGSDAGLQQKLTRLVVGRSPRPGYWGYATRQQLGAQIDRAFPGIYGRLDWSGAPKTRLGAAGTAFDGARIVQTAQTFLTGHLGDAYTQFNISQSEPVPALVLPHGEVQLSARLPSDRLSKRMPVQVDVTLEGEPYQTVTVWFDVSVFAEVLAAKQDLPALAALDEAEFTLDRRDIAVLRDAPVVTASALTGMRLKQPLVQGDALAVSMLEPVPAVAKGQQVEVFVAAGKVSLQTTAVALSDGDVAQRIRVRHIGDSINYPAIVIGRGQVKVD
jgi:flagella basal body P-ring formation protein FlgA